MNCSSVKKESRLLFRVITVVLAAAVTGCAHDQIKNECFVPLLCLPRIVSKPPKQAPEPIPAIAEPPAAASAPEETVADGENMPEIWPVTQHTRISSRFNQRRGRGRAHKGIDMEAPPSTPVLATAAGTVTFSGRHGAYGLIIEIDHHNGYETAYAHLKECLVKKGAEVNRGDKIGAVGTTGNATAFHLHYEVHKEGYPIDPAPYLPQYDDKK